MVRWSDLGASLGATPRVALRWDIWAQVLRRLFCSGVFAGYAVLALLLALLRQAPLALACSALLLPYAVWAITAPVAAALPEYMQLPPAEVESEPPFIRYLLWNIPVFVVAVLLGVVSLLPALQAGWPRVVFAYAGVLLAAPAALKMMTRGTLAAYYDTDASRALVAETRLQRLLFGVPVLLALAGLVQLVLHSVALAWHLLPWEAWAALAILAAVAVATLAGIVGTGMLLLAGARVPVDMVSTQDATQTMVDERGPRSIASTRPMLNMRPLPMPRPPRQRLGWMRQVLRAGGALVALAGTLYLARLPLLDRYLEGDATYRTAAGFIERLQGNSPRYGAVLDASDVEERLRAGYIATACSGDLENAQLLSQLEVPRQQDQARLLACAACNGQRPIVDWLLRTEPQLRVDQAVIATNGDVRRPRTALSCAVRANDVPLARSLLQRGAQPRDLEGAAASVAVAASLQHWEMVRLLLKQDPGAAAVAAFAALDTAYAQDPGRPAEVLPQLLAAGVPALVADRQGRSLFHWAALRHDLKLAQVLLERSGSAPPQETLARTDRQGALPWMYVLRRAELSGEPLSETATQLLKLLLPPGADVNAAIARPLEPGSDDAFPAGWTAAAAAINLPSAREVLGPDLDFGRLSPDPAQWWHFRGPQQAEAFVQGLSVPQLQRAEQPDAPAGVAARPLSVALVDAGWPELADQVQQRLRAKPRR